MKSGKGADEEWASEHYTIPLLGVSIAEEWWKEAIFKNQKLS